MKISFKNIGVISILAAILFACVGVEPIVLNEHPDKPIYKPSDNATDRMAKGVFKDFRTGVSDWWSSPTIKVSKKASTMKVTGQGVGPGYEAFGTNFSPVDFTQVPVIRIRARLDEETKVAPILRMDLKDINNVQTNASPVAAQLYRPEGDSTGGYVDYYYDFNHKWAQSFPSVAKVDPTSIAGMQFFFNPGGEAWSGTIYIDEMYLMPNKDESKDYVETDIVIDDFTGDVNMWWPCKKEKVTVSKASPTAMNIHINDGQWDCFGMVFGEVDITNNPIIRIRAKAQSTTGISTTNVMARFIDADDNATDLIDGLNMSDMEVGGADFAEYYSVFKDSRENNLYSSQGDFDPKRVNRVIIFINMNKEANFTGDIIVDEVAFVEKLPKDVQEERGSLWGPKATMDPTWPEGEAYETIDDCSSKADWTTSSTNVHLNVIDKAFVLDLAAEGSKYEYIEKTLKPLSLFHTDSDGKKSIKYIKVLAKASGNKDAVLRFDFEDSFGNITNARPQEIVIKNNAGAFDEYYVKVANSMYQRSPLYVSVNGQKVEKMKIYFNPGLKDKYDGKVEISNISTVTIDEVPTEWFEKLKDF